jgi:hypothetical protein
MEITAVVAANARIVYGLAFPFITNPEAIRYKPFAAFTVYLMLLLVVAFPHSTVSTTSDAEVFVAYSQTSSIVVVVLEQV